MPLSYKPVTAFLLLLLSAAASFGQPPQRGERNVTVAAIHLNSADPDAAIAFWKDVIGASTYRYESLNGVSTLGATLLFSKKPPSGPTAGSAIDHLALKVPDLQPFVDKLAKTPYKATHPKGADDRLIFDGPDGVRVELMEDNSMYAPLEFNHIHYHSAQPKETAEWYAKNLSGRPGQDDDADSVQFPGAKLTFTQAASVAPTAGRAIDYVVFEVKGLDELCKKLAANGVKFDSAAQAMPEVKARVALLADPSGAGIELMEKTAP